jgi:ribonuclease VapC
MVIDSSAIIAIVNKEDDLMLYLEAIRNDQVRLMSVANWFEVFIAMSRHPNPNRLKASDSLMQELEIDIQPVLDGHGWLARRAWERYGKGKHPAALNFGDCFAYALAESSGEPLLFKGNDFVQTGVKQAISR